MTLAWYALLDFARERRPNTPPPLRGRNDHAAQPRSALGKHVLHLVRLQDRDAHGGPIEPREHLNGKARWIELGLDVRCDGFNRATRALVTPLVKNPLRHHRHNLRRLS